MVQGFSDTHGTSPFAVELLTCIIGELPERTVLLCNLLLALNAEEATTPRVLVLLQPGKLLTSPLSVAHRE